MYNVEFFTTYKHNEDTWRGVTGFHPIPAFSVEPSRFYENPHNYRRCYSFSSYDGVITVKILNSYDVYMKDKLGKAKYLFYKNFQLKEDSKSFDNINTALKYLEDNYNVKIKGV
jgi:hypothetical protein